MLALRLAAGFSALGCLLAAGVLELACPPSGASGGDEGGGAGANTAFQFVQTTDIHGDPIDTSTRMPPLVSEPARERRPTGHMDATARPGPGGGVPQVRIVHPTACSGGAVTTGNPELKFEQSWGYPVKRPMGRRIVIDSGPPYVLSPPKHAARNNGNTVTISFAGLEPGTHSVVVELFDVQGGAIISSSSCAAFCFEQCSGGIINKVTRHKEVSKGGDAIVVPEKKKKPKTRKISEGLASTKNKKRRISFNRKQFTKEREMPMALHAMSAVELEAELSSWKDLEEPLHAAQGRRDSVEAELQRRLTKLGVRREEVISRTKEM